MTRDVATRAASGGVEDANRAVEAAASAFPGWAATGPNARRKLLLAAADLIKAKSGILVAGDARTGAVMAATLVDRVTPAMRLYSEKSFGPAKVIIRVNGVEEAVRVANDTEYGLSVAVFGRDVTRANTAARRIDSGICHINGPTLGDEAQMPFGGMKASGYGRFGGKAAIAEFTDLRWITIESEQHYPF